MDKVRIKKSETLSKGWSTLKKVTYDYLIGPDTWQTQTREAYDRGDGMVALLYNQSQKKVILTRQFRFPTYLNGNPSGLLIEACAGKLEREDPEKGMIREIEEETGHRVSRVEKIFEAYMSPGSVTELIHFYLAPYDESTRVSQGGGLDMEGENIEVLEMSFQDALNMVKSSEIKDAKTIMLLQYAELNLDLL